jgi:uncharacterized membrane protein YphA (DoxX/SURF4 family)
MIEKGKLYDFFIIVIRVWLAYILIEYGLGKLTDTQFGVTSQELNTPLKDLNLFRLSWYLADHEPFKSFIGMSQLIAALLLIFRRTCIIGAFMAIPIWLNILIWDITFMGLQSPFTFRLIYYLLLTCLILLRYKNSVVGVFNSGFQRSKADYQYPIWAYLLIPVIGFAIEFVPMLFRALVNLL